MPHRSGITRALSYSVASAVQGGRLRLLQAVFSSAPIPFSSLNDAWHRTSHDLTAFTRADMVVPLEVGRFITDTMPNAEMVVMRATGHCPHMSAADETIDTIRRFVGP